MLKECREPQINEVQCLGQRSAFDWDLKLQDNNKNVDVKFGRFKGRNVGPTNKAIKQVSAPGCKDQLQFQTLNEDIFAKQNSLSKAWTGLGLGQGSG